MKTVNFKTVELKSLSGVVTQADLSQSLGDILYNAAMSIPVRKLAEKIYYSEGEAEYTDEELGLLKTELETKDFGLFLRVKDALIELSTF